MARENQGLQIALIISVMLTILLGVMTYVFYRQWDEADTRAKANLAKLDEAAKQAGNYAKDLDDLKHMVGLAKPDKADAINKAFAEDMTKYAAGYPEESKFYRPLVQKMSKTIEEKNNEVKKVKDDFAKLEEDYRVREASKQPQIDKFKQEAEKASEVLTKERETFKADRDRVTQAESKLKTDLESARKDALASVTKIEQRLKDAGDLNQTLKGINKRLSEQQETLTSQKFETSQGEVRWVNQHSGTVWIDLGRADALHRQVTFSVFPADVTDLTAGKKASIEVTQILGDHLAEARIADDKLVDPIMPGDKLYTPVWTPGQKQHFALAGYMDIDGNGQNNVQSVINLITMNGGVVDSYIDDKGKQVGEITLNTRFLVQGDAPNEKGLPTMLAAFTKMYDDAGRLGVQTIHLPILLERMGWKNRTAIVRFGRDANPKDFLAKPEEGVQKKSRGSVSDVFQSRDPREPHPPAPRAPSSAY